MQKLRAGGHTLTIDGSAVELVDEDPASAHYSTGTHETLHIEPADAESFELMTCRTVNGALVLYHLHVPTRYRGRGFGKLGVAFFYHVLTTRSVSGYAIKFGGGTKSGGFLEQLGFPSEYIHTAQDADFVGQSVLVGEFTSTGDRPYDWRLDPLPIKTFPTGFFSYT